MFNTTQKSWARELAYCLLICVVLTSCAGGGGEEEEQVEAVDACSVIGYKIANGSSCDIRDDNSPRRYTGSAIVKLLITTAGESGVCTGVAVDQYTVITASHCLLGLPSEVLIETGNGETFDSSDYIIHPNSNIRGDFQDSVLVNDVGLVFSPEPLDIPTLPVLTSRSPQKGEWGVIAGVGQTEPDQEFYGYLHAGSAKITHVSGEHLEITYKDDQSHPCRGDSGGPLLLEINNEWTLAGTVSQSAPSIEEEDVCRPGDVTLYTNLSKPGIASFLDSFVRDIQFR